VQIRKALRFDLDALVAIENRCFTSDRLSRRSLRYFIAAPNAILLVAKIERVATGYALIAMRKGSAIARLYSIAIDPDFRGRNLGLALLKAAEKAARSAGATIMRLEVRSRNRRAIALYEGQGYHRFERIEDYYEDGATALCYRKLLGPSQARHPSEAKPSRLR
jgi:ribosomal protein S18 acetylase RimI-like enzyme